MGLQLIAFLFLAVAAILWIGGAYFYFRTGSQGIVRFIVHLAALGLTVLILWAIILQPVSDCTGFLCGLGEALLFLGLSIMAALVEGLVIFYMSRNYHDQWTAKLSPQTKEISQQDETF
jgi:hypothetical protein